MNDDCLKQVVHPLLAKEGLVGDIELSLLKGGRNNRVYAAAAPDQTPLLLKSYFQHPNDPRNRCQTEFAFSTFCWDLGIRCIAKPLQLDVEAGIAVYEFVKGASFADQEVTFVHVDEALQFFAQVNAGRSTEKASVLAPASEACFSINSHLQVVDARVQALIESSDRMPEKDCKTVDSEFRQFAQQKLVPAWKDVRANVEKECEQLRLSPEHEVPIDERILSPSDFGFHNAICKPDGKLCFVDFEYAGWDDIAKTVNDFFIQPTHPVSEKYLQHFLKNVLEGFQDKELEIRRIEILKPVMAVKWVCILLNEFLSVSGLRRKFALGLDPTINESLIEEEERKRKVRQLNLASTTLERVRFSLASK